MPEQFYFDNLLPLPRLSSTYDKVRSSSLTQLSELFGSMVGPSLDSKSTSGQNSRKRLFTLPLIFWAFLSQVLSPGSSCREALRSIAAFLQIKEDRDVNSDTSAYCQARLRLPLELLHNIAQRVAGKLEQMEPTDTLWRGHSLKVIDGATSSMPDTPSNQKQWPQSSTQKKGCGFPIMRIVGLFSLATGALLRAVHAATSTSEYHMFMQLLGFLSPNDVLLADRGFCSYANIVSLLAMEVHAVMRLHQSRRVDFRKGIRLSKNDSLVTWTKPNSQPKVLTQQQYAALPKTLTVRMVRFRIQTPGFRTKEITLVTTLLNAEIYPPSELAALYLRRWNIELNFRNIKTTMKMEVLRCKSPEMIERELAMHFIAYNLVRYLMLEASICHHVPLDRISFKGSLDTLRQWSPVLAAEPKPRKRAALIRSMLEILADDRLPFRPGRREPRAIKRRPKPYQLLTKPRSIMRDRIQSHRRRRPITQFP